MIDATVTAVIRLYEQGTSVKEIARRLNIGHQKVLQILVTAGLAETDESRLQKQGKTVEEICEILGKSRKVVLPRLPYSKGQYGPSTRQSMRYASVSAGENEQMNMGVKS